MMSALAVAAWLTAEAGQALQAAAPAAAVNSSSVPVLRTICASLAISHAPPARQASRGQPGGTSRASAQTASAQSRRPAGTSRAPARPSQLIAPRAPPRPPARLPRARARAPRPPPAVRPAAALPGRPAPPPRWPARRP